MRVAGWTALLVLAIDQITKLYVIHALELDRRHAIVNDAVDASYLVDNPVRYPSKQFMRKMCPMSRHEILRLDRAQGNDVFIGTAITHYTN